MPFLFEAMATQSLHSSYAANSTTHGELQLSLLLLGSTQALNNWVAVKWKELVCDFLTCSDRACYSMSHCVTCTLYNVCIGGLCDDRRVVLPEG